MNKVEWELEGSTNVDQVVNKTTNGLNGIERNAKRVSDSFTLSASSIFLKFLGPMALLQAAIGWISNAIETSKQQAKEAMDFAVKGESAALDATTAYQAQKYAAEDKAKSEKEMAEQSKQQIAERYLRENESKVMDKLGSFEWMKYIGDSYSNAAKDKDLQKVIDDLIKEDMGKNRDVLTKVKGTDFKGPEGFSNVVGVGASPVLEAMTQQLEVQRDMLNQLQLANANKTPDPDFTKSQFRPTPYGL